MLAKHLTRSITFIEILGFSVLILFLWLDELLDLPHTILGAPATPVNLSESIFETSVVLVLAAVVCFFTRYLARRLQTLNEEKDKLFSLISHDLRNSFTSLLSYSAVLRSNPDKFSLEEIGELAGGINNSAKNLSHLLENLLQWARLAQGKFIYHPQKVPLAGLISSALGLYATQAAQKRIQLINQVETSAAIYADPTMMNSILQNLISNAIKFTPEGGKICLTTVDLGRRIKITVSDNGIGIARDQLRDIFKAQTGSSTLGTNGEKGTGLGLVVCREFIELNCGRISAASEPGLGTIFSIILSKVA